jgi:hypothetical protein
MSEDEVESFEITDYDLDNEFNTARPRRKLSKKQQMLGALQARTFIHVLSIELTLSK